MLYFYLMFYRPPPFWNTFRLSFPLSGFIGIRVLKFSRSLSSSGKSLQCWNNPRASGVCKTILWSSGLTAELGKPGSNIQIFFPVFFSHFSSLALPLEEGSDVQSDRLKYADGDREGMAVS